MFSWLKNLLGKNDVKTVPEIVPENLLLIKINCLIYHLLSHAHRVEEIKDLDNRFVVKNYQDDLNFYVVSVYGRTKIGYCNESYRSYTSGIWDTAFSRYLDELNSKCAELKRKEIQAQKESKENREKAIIKLFEKDV